MSKRKKDNPKQKRLKGKKQNQNGNLQNNQEKQS
jgi:hypothetical protein